MQLGARLRAKAVAQGTRTKKSPRGSLGCGERANPKPEPRRWVQELTFEHQGLEVLQARQDAQCSAQQAVVGAEPQELHLHHLCPPPLEELQQPAAASGVHVQIQPVVRQAAVGERRSPRSPLPVLVAEPRQLCHLLRLVHRGWTCSSLPCRQAPAAPPGSRGEEEEGGRL